ncbi:MAG: PFL family protein [Chlorobiota bacterium]|nr:MAG: PFL family protein [Chlorobiota bacterium]
MNFDFTEVLETIMMSEVEHFDIRTVTMGINLRDCSDRNINVVTQKIYEKITRLAGNHVKNAESIEAADSFSPEEYVKIAEAMDRAAHEIGIDYIGGYSALVQKGMTPGEKNFILSIPQALSTTKKVCSSVNIGSTKAGINIDAIKMMAQVIKDTAYITRDAWSIGCAKLVVFCNAVEDNPFIAGAFHGITEGDATLNVGVSGPGVVLEALKNHKGASIQEIAEVIKKTAFKITRAGELVGRKVAEKDGVEFGIVDISLAPTPAEGDSIADILKEIGLEDVGAPGTTAALAMLNDSVKKGGLMASSSVGGLSGAFIPVSEDQGMISAAEKGHLTIEKLEAMTAVCSVGLDMVAIPGDTPVNTIAGIIADEAAIGLINEKTTACRLIPAYGKGVGESVDYGGLLGKAPIMPVKVLSSDVFFNRGGKIPAPVRSLTN